MQPPSVPTYFACGLCDRRQEVYQPDDIRAYQRDKSFMLLHYKNAHAERFGTLQSTPGVAFSEWWKFGPIPDAIGPVLHYEGNSYPWSQS